MEYKSPAIHRTPIYRAKAAYANMRRRCGIEKAYLAVELRMTLEEWLDWSLPRYLAFEAAHPGERPNAARNNDRGHYEIGNIEIISATANRAAMAAPLVLREDGTKLCMRCRGRKVAAEFYSNRSTFDRLSDYCKSCDRERARKYRERNLIGRVAVL